MSKSKMLREALDEQVIADRIAFPHDDARRKYLVVPYKARDSADFERIIGDYYAYHHGACISHGGRMPEFHAVQAAKRIIENAYRRRNQTIVNAMADGKDGRNGAMPQILNLVADGLKNEAIEAYVAETIDRAVTADSFAEKKAFVEEVLADWGHLLPERIRRRKAEELAADYRELISSLTDVVREAAGAFRRV